MFAAVGVRGMNRAPGVDRRGAPRRSARIFSVPTPADAEIIGSGQSRATQPREGCDPAREREGEHQQDPRPDTPSASLGVAGGPEARARGGAHAELLVGTLMCSVRPTSDDSPLSSQHFFAANFFQRPKRVPRRHFSYATVVAGFCDAPPWLKTARGRSPKVCHDASDIYARPRPVPSPRRSRDRIREPSFVTSRDETKSLPTRPPLRAS